MCRFDFTDKREFFFLLFTFSKRINFYKFLRNISIQILFKRSDWLQNWIKKKAFKNYLKKKKKISPNKDFLFFIFYLEKGFLENLLKISFV